MPDDQRNPYAPPAEPIRAFRFRANWDSGPSEYESERRPVWLCILLAVVTLGFYTRLWPLLRRPFLDRLDTGRKLGELLPIFIVVVAALSFAAAFIPEAAPVRTLLWWAATVANLFANFRVLAILRSDAARTDRFVAFSPVATFFLGIFYLQYKINQLADTPARVAKPKRKKKRKKPSVEAAEEPAITDV
jgi:hypothetical protein